MRHSVLPFSVHSFTVHVSIMTDMVSGRISSATYYTQKMITRDGQHDTTIIDADTNTYSIDTWFLMISIRYSAHMGICQPPVGNSDASKYEETCAEH